METFPEGNAIVYCEGAFNTPTGKTAHGLVRKTNRYRVLAVVDSHYAGSDAGMILDGVTKNIPIVTDVEMAKQTAAASEAAATHFVVGLAPDGGRLDARAREQVIRAIQLGLNVDCGLHDFLSRDREIVLLAKKKEITIRDIRKPPPRHHLHFFNGKIEQVDCLKVAVLGTDSAVGKRTTAWILVDALTAAGYLAEFIGTGQTAWMQGARNSIILDSIVNDFVSGEIEHIIWTAWKNYHPDVIIIEGQGSLMNPAYPGGFEILAAGRPDLVIVQHAPGRRDYDGFPGYAIHPVEKQVQAIELISNRPVVAITINHENLARETISDICESIQKKTGLPTVDILVEGTGTIVQVLISYLRNFPKTRTINEPDQSL